ncbi:unnamed protein product [Parascedosporium putredinis]|uniref:Uncharacterized protein n=1 Tax=Parascedosporium putredinis TaxID=1442378 RepID=A0A9P1H9Q7_9PEZI|nr:unnamed protein product [Parascedosporium putredinis]CAI8001217.1 unnamed protein product [Parascedosporium putredinis]
MDGETPTGRLPDEYPPGVGNALAEATAMSLRAIASTTPLTCSKFQSSQLPPTSHPPHYLNSVMVEVLIPHHTSDVQKKQAIMSSDLLLALCVARPHPWLRIEQG